MIDVLNITNETVEETVKKYGHSDKNTGSTIVQVMILKNKIDRLNIRHFSVHRKDKHSKLGLVKMVSKMRKLIKYLKSTDQKSYEIYLANKDSNR